MLSNRQMKAMDKKRDAEIDEHREWLVNMWKAEAQRTITPVFKGQKRYKFGIFDPSKVYKGGFSCYLDEKGALFLATTVFDTEDEFKKVVVCDDMRISSKLLRNISLETATSLFAY